MDWIPIIGLEGVLVTACAAVILSAVAALLIGIGWINHRRAQATLAWPAAPGQVVAAVVGAQSGEDGPTYFPHITYTYSVGERTFQNDRLVIGGGITGNRGPAERIVARYPAGTNVPVYYNPANPQDAVLERRSGSTRFLVALGGFLFLMGCGLFACVTTAFLVRAAG